MNLLHFFEQNWQAVAWSAGILAGAIVVALLARAIVFWLLKKLNSRKESVIGDSLLRRGQGPTHWVFPLIAILSVLPGLPLPHPVLLALEHIAGLALIAACAWLAILSIAIVSDVVSGRYRIDVADNLTARRVQTQFQMVHRIAVVLVTVVALSIALMTFPAIKQLGVSILASAGLASLIVGMSMKGTLSNLVAGVQIAFAQPFRMGDVVVVENEWGWIEEIGMMYVVVRIWDLRRLVLPLSYFLDHPFQNWTRVSADILGYVYVYTDYTVPVDALREELRRICKASPLWGGTVCGIQVTDADAQTMQVRALMDSRNSGDAWDLRCLVREKLIDFLQKNYPGSLPRHRGEFETSALPQPGQTGETQGAGAGASAPGVSAQMQENGRRSAASQPIRPPLRPIESK